MTEERLREIEETLGHIPSRNAAGLTARTYAEELLNEVRRLRALFGEDDAIWAEHAANALRETHPTDIGAGADAVGQMLSLASRIREALHGDR